jgi:diguanylate cyclase (GGDEF)-like protein
MERSEEGRDAPRQHAATAGSVLAFLFVVSGVATLGTTLLPAPRDLDGPLVAVVGLAAIVGGIVVLLLPWRRWPLRASLVAVPGAFALISVHNTAGGSDAHRYSLFYVVAFVWIGMFHPRWTPTAASALAAPSYLAPLLITGAPASAIASVFYAVPMFILVGEVIAWQADRLRQLRHQLARQALHDCLTGLPNRRLLMEALERALARARRTAEPIGLLFLDLDGFKAVNDEHGHAAGDDLLVTVADVLRDLTRATDVPARLAGDEFAVLVELPSGSEPLDGLARRISSEVARRAADAGLDVGASIGAVTADGTGTGDELLCLADAAMYSQKHARRERRRTGEPLTV